MEVREFDIVFNRLNPNDKRKWFSRVLSKLIYFFQKNRKSGASAKITHTGTRVSIERNMWVSEMQGRGARLTDWERYKEKYTGEIWRLYIPIKERGNVIKHMIEVCGVLKYDFFGLVMIQTRKSILKKLNPEWGKLFERNYIKRKGKKCSTWTNHIMNIAFGLDYKNNINPSELYRYVTSLNCSEKIGEF